MGGGLTSLRSETGGRGGYKLEGGCLHPYSSCSIQIGCATILAGTSGDTAAEHPWHHFIYCILCCILCTTHDPCDHPHFNFPPIFSRPQPSHLPLPPPVYKSPCPVFHYHWWRPRLGRTSGNHWQVTSVAIPRLVQFPDSEAWTHLATQRSLKCIKVSFCWVYLDKCILYKILYKRLRDSMEGKILEEQGAISQLLVLGGIRYFNPVYDIRIISRYAGI